MTENTKFNLRNELIILLLLALPIIYLTVIFDRLPDEVPTHFNIKGEADDWTNKSQLYTMFGLISGGMYLLLLLIPFIDPKNQIGKMGNKFFIIKLIMAGLLSVIFIAMLYTASNGSDLTHLLPLILIVFFMGLGNYLQSVKPNYFIGIRTPWTLESPANWTATHRFTGRLWLIGFGLLLVAYFLTDTILFNRYFFWITIVLAFIPIGYSFVFFLRTKKRD